MARTPAVRPRRRRLAASHRDHWTTRAGGRVARQRIRGAAAAIDRFEAASETRVHTSPPSMADLHAAERALRINRDSGEKRRRRLAALVARFRHALGRLGLTP